MPTVKTKRALLRQLPKESDVTAETVRDSCCEFHDVVIILIVLELRVN